MREKEAAAETTVKHKGKHMLGRVTDQDTGNRDVPTGVQAGTLGYCTC